MNALRASHNSRPFIFTKHYKYASKATNAVLAKPAPKEEQIIPCVT